MSVAVGDEVEHFAALPKPRCGEQKALGWDISVPWGLPLPSSPFPKQSGKGEEGSWVYIF